MDRELLLQLVGQHAAGGPIDPERLQCIAESTTHSLVDGSRYTTESLYLSDDGDWFSVEFGLDMPAPRVVALTEKAALEWCVMHGVNRSVIARHFVCDTDFGPSNELLALLHRKWGGAASESLDSESILRRQHTLSPDERTPAAIALSVCPNRSDLTRLPQNSVDGGDSGS